MALTCRQKSASTHRVLVAAQAEVAVAGGQHGLSDVDGAHLHAIGGGGAEGIRIRKDLRRKQRDLRGGAARTSAHMLAEHALGLHPCTTAHQPMLIMKLTFSSLTMRTRPSVVLPAWAEALTRTARREAGPGAREACTRAQA